MPQKKDKRKKDDSKNDPLATPVMRQFLELKDKYKGSILFFRMGDFYELFLEDAKEAASIMDVALTARQGGVPMCGVPFHSADNYIARLLQAGKKVAVAEQEADPENPKLMRRVVRRILSRSTLVEESLLRSGEHNFLMALVCDAKMLGVAVADVSTGDFFALEMPVRDGGCDEGGDLRTSIRDIYSRYSPGEIIVSSDDFPCIEQTLPGAKRTVSPQEPWKASPTEGVRRINSRFSVNLKGLGFDSESHPSLGAISLLLHYVTESFPGTDINLDPPVLRRPGGQSVLLDEQTVRNLDLVYNAGEGSVDRTLFRVLDKCKSTAGKRYLKEAILSPLLEQNLIEKRQQAIEVFIGNRNLHEEVMEHLSGVSDLDRILSRMKAGRGAPRDFGAIRNTIHSFRQIHDLCRKHSGDVFFEDSLWPDKDLLEFASAIENSVVDEPGAVLGNSPFIRENAIPELDRAREAKDKGARWLLEFEAEERSRTGIQTLKVKYNRVVGYFIEVSRGQSGNVPSEYRRRQTLVGNERYSCDRLEDLERDILGSEGAIEEIEQREFKRLCDRTIDLHRNIKSLMRTLSHIDFISSLATVAVSGGWVKPLISQTGELAIEDGRHPVVEAYLSPGESFIPNSVALDGQSRKFAVLTGPNMAGKSTYIRQVAVIQILTQMGSYVPAAAARLSIADNIFTRIGAGDNLTRGESTFFVEMLETARILNRCTDKSLIVMDEVGRGTSTYDGMSIAWAVVEYLTEGNQSPKTLFATHYHELTSLESRDGVFNLTMDVREIGGKVVFLRKVKEGAADDSYGIHVARLAGLPPELIQRASEKLKELEEDLTQRTSRKPARKGTRISEKSDSDGSQQQLF